MIDVICALLIIFIIHTSISCCKRRDEGDDDATTSISPIPSLPKASAEIPSLKLKTCIDDDMIEINPTQADEEENPELVGKVWEEAGEIEAMEPAKAPMKEVAPAKTSEKEPAKTSEKEPVTAVEAKTLTEKEERKPLEDVEKKKDEVEGPAPPPKPKKKEPKSMWDVMKRLEETQPDLIDYTSIRAPPNVMEMMEQKHDAVKAGSLGDLLNQLVKAKKDREKNIKPAPENAPAANVRLELPRSPAPTPPTQQPKEILETPRGPTPPRPLASKGFMSWNKSGSQKTSGTQKAKSEPIPKKPTEQKNKASSKVAKRNQEAKKKSSVKPDKKGGGSMKLPKSGSSKKLKKKSARKKK
ncbi:hypothetical protein GCK32_020430 [Trichostrongylus colubriformis]|uniref:Uncharacterized protein n=1 Tax=Trichostrongylus colubriformis TaxID=6319 RepID=A0AAN8FD45_TRICO